MAKSKSQTLNTSTILKVISSEADKCIFTRQQLMEAQNADESLVKCIAEAKSGVDQNRNRYVLVDECYRL